MTQVVKKVYEEYWQFKEGMENFDTYERNQVLKDLFKVGDKVLDLACGEGAVSEFLKSIGCEVIAFDISPGALKKVSKRGIKTIEGDVEKKLPFKNGEFDGVFWGDNAEHLFLPGQTLKEIYRVLNASGRVVISCPNMGYWRYRLEYLFSGMVPKTEWFRKNPWEWEHIRFFNKQVMENMLRASGLTLTQFFGISRRKLDQPLKPFFPDLFGMIMVVVGVKASSKK